MTIINDSRCVMCGTYVPEGSMVCPICLKNTTIHEIKIRKRVKSHKPLKWVLFSIWLVLTPYIFVLADRQRGYEATGGEIVWFLVPLIVWIVADTLRGFNQAIRDTLNEVRKEKNNVNRL